MAERIFLHVGTPKSGTTYLQAVMWQTAESLRAQGLLLPGTFQTHYAAAKGVTSRNPGRATKVSPTAAFPKLVKQVNRWDHDALISHELLAPATPAQARVAKEGFGAAEVHIVLTARALHKQLPASWQQQVKGGYSTTYDDFLGQVRDGKAKGQWFWQVQDLAALATRWGADIPPGRIHVVTVPSDSSDPLALWRRYASVFGIDPDSADTAVPRKNMSLGPVESELLRQVHAHPDSRFRGGGHYRWTRRLLAVDVLGKRRGAPIALPEGQKKWLVDRTELMLDAIDDAGYDVVGDLDDLRWQPSPPESRLVSSVSQAELDEVSEWTIGRLQEHWVHLQPTAAPPAVGPEEGVGGILELLEHIRSVDTGEPPRPASTRSTSRSRRGLGALRRR